MISSGASAPEGGVDPQMTLSVRSLNDQIIEGRIRIPAFQRGFVWDMDRVAHFIDSLHKGFPFGSLLLWRTRNKLVHERDLGPYKLPPHDPALPIDYVLDGQQRITSIFAVFQTELPRIDDPEWLDIYFDFESTVDAQESQFVPLLPEEVDSGRYFPLKTIYDPTAFRAATSDLPGDQVKVIDQLYSRFKELQLPVQYFETEDRTRVAIVFERVNRKGLELDTLQLLTAWTWSEEFDLQNRFRDLREGLADYGFSDVGEDSNLVLRCAAAILQRDPEAESLISLSGAEVREKFPCVENGIKGAVDFLRAQMNVETLSNLPYPALLVPLSVFFAEPDSRQVIYSEDTYRRIVRWFWRACFSGRYSGQTVRAARADITEMHRLKSGESSNLGDFTATVDDSFFLGTNFRANSAKSKTFVLLLAQHRPRSFISGSRVPVGPVLQQYNRSEFHHIYPRRFLATLGEYDEKEINCLANFCFLNRAENNHISGNAPSQYRQLMPNDADEILSAALCPASTFSDDYRRFLGDRAKLLASAARELMENPPVTGRQEEVDEIGLLSDPAQASPLQRQPIPARKNTNTGARKA